MKVLAFDPGESTGYAVVLSRVGNPYILDSGELPFNWDLGNRASHLRLVHRPDILLVEDVVLGGPLDRDKLIQVRAHDRIVNAVMPDIDWAYGRFYNAPPEARRHPKVTVPREVKGRHARDAARHALAWLARQEAE